MSDTEEVTVRKTRSGRTITPVAKQTKTKPTPRKTRKKVVVMEVEVTDDEENDSPLEGAPSKKKFKPNESEEELLSSEANLNKALDDTNLILEENVGLFDESFEASAIEILDEEQVADTTVIENQLIETSDDNEVEVTNNTAEENEGQGNSDDDNDEDGDDDLITNDVNGKHELMETYQVVEENGDAEEIDENVLLEEEGDDEEQKAKVDATAASDDDDNAEENNVEKMDVGEEVASSGGANNVADPEAENISDEELPGVPVAKVPETEEVSDEELPGPKRAELPADTEVVSEDEFPASKKDPEDETSLGPISEDDAKKKATEGDYDPTSPTSETDTPIKKSKDDKDEKDKEGSEHNKLATKPKKLPELDKYWKAVNDDPTDFTGWTYLLQYVDQENDMEAAREAYDAFLSHYPYCYGYWRKYTDYEKRKGNKKKCEEVFERGLKAIPLSVDLWIHYLTYVKTTRSEDEEYIRSQFERALSACGLEFRSDRLWDSYIKWETEAKRLQRVTRIYDRLLATPTQSYNTHFDNFQEHVTSNPPNKVVDVDEFLALRKEVRNILKHDSVENVTENADVPPGDEDSKLCSTDEETKAIRERIISIRRKIHKNTTASVTARWNFEEGIKRPYFHVKPLERCQLKNWQDYIDYEIEQGDNVRIVVLFERCLIACALYDEYWLKFVHYLEGLKDPEQRPKIRDVYERACTIHHLKKPNLHLQWALFEESCGNINRAAEILVNLEKQVPSVLQVAFRRINLERRRADYEKCTQLFEHYIANFKNKTVCSNISLKYSRFCLRILKDYNKAHEVIKAAIAKDSNNPRLYLQLIDLTLQNGKAEEEEICGILNEFLEKENIDSDQKVLFAQRKLEYLEDFGSKVEVVQSAYEDYQKYIKQSKENTKKKENRSDATPSGGKKEKAGSSASQVNSYGNYSYGSGSGPSTPSSYPYPAGSQQGQYNYSQYGQGEQYQYQNWQYPQGGYGGYNQWGGYGGSYGY